MNNKETVRVNFEFPRAMYPHLKFLCASRGKSIKEFMTEMTLRELESAEDLELGRISNERITTREEGDLIDRDDATKLAGW